MKITPFLGELSGKLGGVVASRNRAGSYLRRWVIPVNPNSARQATVRALFGNASQTYHSLTDAQKANWGYFAEEHFQPKVGENVGQFSGFNAFCSLRMTTNMGGNLAVTPSITDSEDTALPCTPDGFSPAFLAPADTLQANINNGPGAPLTVNASNIEIYEDFSFLIELDWVDVGESGLAQGELKDGGGMKYGIALSISEILPQESSFVSNPYRTALGFISPITFTTPETEDLTGTAGIKISGGPAINPANYQSLPEVGNIVRASVWAVSEAGQVACLAHATTTVSESPV